MPTKKFTNPFVCAILLGVSGCESLPELTDGDSRDQINDGTPAQIELSENVAAVLGESSAEEMLNAALQSLASTWPETPW